VTTRPRNDLGPGEVRRVWRLRKDHTSIDARIREREGTDAVELQLFYDGTLVVARTWPSREAALADAEGRRGDFQRAGWNSHW
jgi:hypothetical protein